MAAWSQVLVVDDDVAIPAPPGDERERPVLPVSGRSIPPGGITPFELRNVELRESFRGYQRDEVDALCERAAETIEHLERCRRDLEERLRHGMELQSGAPSAARRAARPARRSSHEAAQSVDVIQRTLLMAQKSADEAMAEAEAYSERVVGEADAKATALVSDAETKARSIADEALKRVETEVADLSAKRNALTVDVDTLEHFAEQYRDRIRRAIESELDRLGMSSMASVVPPPAPQLHDASGAAPPATTELRNEWDPIPELVIDDIGK